MVPGAEVDVGLHAVRRCRRKDSGRWQEGGRRHVGSTDGRWVHLYATWIRRDGVERAKEGEGRYEVEPYANGEKQDETQKGTRRGPGVAAQPRPVNLACIASRGDEAGEFLLIRWSGMSCPRARWDRWWAR